MVARMSVGVVPDSGRLAGIVTTSELRRAGVTEARIMWLVGQSVLISVGRGLYARFADVSALSAVPGGPSALRIAAAAAAVGTQTVGSHRDAARIHGLDLLGRRGPDAVAVTREPGLGGSKTSRPGIRLHIAALPPEHRAVRLGAPVTSVARTVIDLARTIPFREGVVVADSALRRELTTKAELGDLMQGFDRWPGIR